MKQLIVLMVLAGLVIPAFPQDGTVVLRVHAVMVDRDLNQKPAPRLALVLIRSDGGGEPVTSRTGFDGRAELRLLPGNYRLRTPDGLELQGKQYSWEMDVTVSSPETTVTLSNDNAKVVDAAAQAPVRQVDELASLFRKYQNSVMTVWSEFGHGTGFVVDPNGLILTNQHVVGPSEYIAVQFDEKRKVEAKMVAFDAERDIAVLWANLAPFPEVIPAPLAKSSSEKAPLMEGERVFTIGSPLNQRKILTTGVVSKVETHAILSDININEGNSGGPLFNSVGTVVGLTTFGDSGAFGPGVSGIVRIEEAELLLERARAKMRDLIPPGAALLPVEPPGMYPIDALKSSLRLVRLDTRPYVFGQGDYDVAIITPVVKYHLTEGARMQAVKEKERRTARQAEATRGTFQPLEGLRNWAEYTGDYKPVILIYAKPKLRETFGSALRRGLTSDNSRFARPATMRFKTDFYRMRLLCGDKEILPIQPAKIANVLNVQNSFVKVTDATYEGVYSYPYDAISPQCGAVTLELFSEKEPERPVVKVLDAETIMRVTADFEPFRKSQIDLAAGNPSKQ